jgi:CRISPR-associated helicase Cas3
MRNDDEGALYGPRAYPRNRDEPRHELIVGQPARHVRVQRLTEALTADVEYPVNDIPRLKSGRPWSRWESDRRAAGWPQGGRHEELSRRLVAAWLDGRPVEWDSDLVLHVVATHHGYARPLILPVPDGAAADIHAEIDGAQVAVSGDLGEVDWEQPARFRRCCERYGYWGLALLEAIVRQADHQVSALGVV